MDCRNRGYPSAIQSTLSDDGPMNPSQEELDQLDALDVLLEGYLTQMDQMEPSLIGWQSNEVPLNDVVLEPLRLMLMTSIDWHF